MLNGRRICAASQSLARIYRPNRLSTCLRRPSSTQAAVMDPPKWREWKVDPPSAIPPSSTTLSSQAGLPSLPVPPLDQTLALLQASCRPFASSDQLSALDRKLSGFRQGLGPVLQKRLEEHAKTQEDVGNWIAEWWDLGAYMSYRGPVVINVSYYYCFTRLPQSPSSSSSDSTADPSFLAASISATAQDFRSRLVSGSLPVDKFAGSPVCMESYKWAFNACRIPAKGSDFAVKIREDAAEGNHVLAIRNHRFYKVPLPDPSLPYATRVSALQTAFAAVRKEADSQPAGEPLGFLTASDRDPWAVARQSLISHSSGNLASLQEIEKAAWVVCLDAATLKRGKEEDEERFFESVWHGGQGETSVAGNRWWDKPINYVVTDNGESGIIGEHSCMDGTPTAALNDWLTNRLLGTGSVPPPPAPPSPAPAVPTLTPIELSFDIPDDVTQATAEAKQRHFVAVEENRLKHRVYSKYGKETIKGYKTSPDGWVQMVIQLAWALTMRGKGEIPCGTYESAQVRKFKLGRTEVVRTVSEASAKWVASMTDSSAPPSSPVDQRALFRAAVAAHGTYMKGASAGMGIDRHLLGLKMLMRPDDKDAKEGKELFEDPVVKRAGTWNLSTSQIYSRHFPGYGWGAVVEDGFGIPYMIHSESLQFTVTGKKHMPVNEMRENLAKAADLVLEMHEKAAREEQSQGQEVKAKL